MPKKIAFVTGSTGLLGNNLVRTLLEEGFLVRALVRNLKKAEQQFSNLSGVEIIEGDVQAVETFADALMGVDVLFHTAAYFRDSYTGGAHWDSLYKTNVEGTLSLLKAAYAGGIRRLIHTSSIATLKGPQGGGAVNETMLRREEDADDYYKSKILTDKTIDSFIAEHPDFKVTFVLPAWMHGPGDLGPTSAGQFALDFMNGRLPGIIDSSFSFVDARDVAKAMISAVENGRSGERYLAAGRSMTMAEIYKVMEKVSGKVGPKNKIPMALLWVVGGFNEIYARITKKPVLVGLASVRVLVNEREHSQFDHAKSARELGITFRPVEDTLADVLASYRQHKMLPAK